MTEAIALRDALAVLAANPDGPEARAQTLRALFLLLLLAQGGDELAETVRTYAQNLATLEAAWASRIANYAAIEIRKLKPEFGEDTEGLRLAASEDVTARLLLSEHWADVRATDISDIAYEAVSKLLLRTGQHRGATTED